MREMRWSRREDAVMVEFLSRLPLICEDLAAYRYHNAFGQTLRVATSPPGDKFWINLACPLLLLAGCERLYMKMDYLEDFAMEDMLATTIAGLDLVREAIVDHSTTTQPASHAMHSGRDDQVDGIKDTNYVAEVNGGQAAICTRGHRTRGTSGVSQGLEVLRQLGLFAQIRFQLATIYRAYLFADPEEDVNQSVHRQINTIARDSKDMLDNPTLRPLGDALQQELNVMRAAHRGQQNAKFCQTEDIVAILLELRTAIAAWNAPQKGELAVLRIRMTGIMRTLTEKLSVFSRSQIDRTGARWGHKVVASTEHSTVVGNSNGHRGHVVESGDSSELTQSTHHKRARVTGRSFSYQCPPVLSNDADMSCRTVHDAERVILEHSRRWEDPDGLEVATGDFTYRLCDRQTCV